MGLAWWREGTPDPEWDLVKTKPSRHRAGPAMENLRLKLKELQAEEPITAIFVEEQFGHGKKLNFITLKKLMHISGFADWFGHQVGAGVHWVEINDWKKHFFLEKRQGDRDHQKMQSVRAAHANGWMVSSDDEADALGILCYGLHCLGVKPPWAERRLFGGRLG